MHFNVWWRLEEFTCHITYPDALVATSENMSGDDPACTSACVSIWGYSKKGAPTNLNPWSGKRLRFKVIGGRRQPLLTKSQP